MILIIDLNEKPNSLHYLEFITPITDLIKNSKVIHFSNLKPKDLKANKIILAGTSLKNSSYLKQYKKFSWIKEINKPLLGICAGMQIIAKVFNSKITKNTEIGPTLITKSSNHKLFNNIKEVYSLHNLSITLPKYFKIHLKSKKSIQAIKHNTKEIYGALFHPEVLNKELILKFTE